MPEMHYGQRKFTYSVWGPFSINKERIQKIKETGDSRYIIETSSIKRALNITWLMGL